MEWNRKSQILAWLEFLQKMNLKQTRVGLREHSKHNNIVFTLLILFKIFFFFFHSCCVCALIFIQCSGYIPPEYVRKGLYSTKSDVFSFGVLLLQIISGKKITKLYGVHEHLNLLDYVSLLYLYITPFFHNRPYIFIAINWSLIIIVH